MVELGIILALVLVNGFFAGAEIAILTARRGRLEQLAAAGNASARTALDLAGDPNRFLPTVQVGITLVGTFAAAFGGASLVTELAIWLDGLGIQTIARYDRQIALLLIAIGISFVSLVLGELVPKRIALQRAEKLACVVAYPMYWLGRIARPAVWLLSAVTNAVLVLTGNRQTRQASIALEDIQHLIRTGTAEGLIEEAEQRVAIEALRLGDRTVKHIMRPRIDIDALEINTPAREVAGAMAMAGFSRLPVYEGSIDHIVGFVYLKDVFRQQYMSGTIDLRKLVRPALFVPENLPLDRLLKTFQEDRKQLAIVLDEYGGTEGMVTLEDVIEELVGEIRDEHRREDEQRIVRRDDLSWLVDGTVGIYDFLRVLPEPWSTKEPPDGITTVSGLVLTQLGRVPKVGETVTWQDLRVEVVDMDGPRIDRLLIELAPPPQPVTTTGEESP